MSDAAARGVQLVGEREGRRRFSAGTPVLVRRGSTDDAPGVTIGLRALRWWSPVLVLVLGSGFVGLFVAAVEMSARGARHREPHRPLGLHRARATAQHPGAEPVA